MTTARELAQSAAAVIGERSGWDRFDVAVVLGSGWHGVTSTIPVRCELDYATLAGFHPTGVPGHAGHVVCAEVHGHRMLLMSGRTHLYEGFGVDAAVHNVRVAAATGCATLILTNGAGSMHLDWPPGTPVLLADHINLTGRTPLVGPSFVDMVDAYSPRLRALAKRVDADLPEGVYAQVHGPQYETPAEVRMASAIGADLVGMSTALETITARSLGLEVLGLSLVTNIAAGMSDSGVHHDDILHAGLAARDRVSALLLNILEAL